MPISNRRILPRLAAACVLAGGGFGLWMAFWKSSATGDLHLTSAKLQDPAAPAADLTLVMNDLQGLSGGDSLEVRLDGRVSGSSVRPPANGEYGMQAIPIEGKIDPARARALIETCVKDGALEVKRLREVGVADEPIIALSIRSTTNGVTSERKNWLWSGEVKDHPSFRATYEALKSLAHELAKEK